MTTLTKEIRREAHATIREAGQDRPIIVSLEPPGILGFRAKGCRMVYRLPVSTCYTMAVRAKVLTDKAEARKRKRRRGETWKRNWNTTYAQKNATLDDLERQLRDLEAEAE